MLLPRFKTSNFPSFARDLGMVPTRKIGGNQVISRVRTQFKIKNACLKVGCLRDLAVANSPGFPRFPACTLRKNERRIRWSVGHEILNVDIVSCEMKEFHTPVKLQRSSTMVSHANKSEKLRERKEFPIGPAARMKV